MPVERANTRRTRPFRRFAASPWTDVARIAAKKAPSVNIPSATVPPYKNSVTVPSATVPPYKNNDHHQVLLDPELRRKWIEEVQGRSTKHRCDLLRFQLSPQIGKLSPLPIECKGQVAHAYEFFKDVYVPSNTATPGFKTCCQVIQQDEMLFEQMMAYALALQNQDKPPKQRMTAPSLYHSIRSVSQLRQRLQAPRIEDRTSDTVIMTILLLIAFYVTCGEFEPWSLHMKALRRVTELRGGSGKLGWDGFLHLKVSQVESTWTTFEARKTSVEQVETGLAYPAHPFSPALCSQISKLPSGFRELALRHRLSLQFIGVMEESLRRMEDANTPSAIAIISLQENVISRPELTVLERALSMAVISCSISKVLAREGIPPSVDIARQLHARSFPSGRGMYSEGSPEEDAFDWAALVLRATTKTHSTAWNWAIQRINSGSAGLALGSRKSDLQKKFLEIPT